MKNLLNFVALLAFQMSVCLAYTPVVMYHGMGDTAFGSIISIKKYLESQLPGIYVTSIQMGKNSEEDFLNSFFMNLNEQVAASCKIISENPKLQNGYNAIGFSQGGQILRAIAQRCLGPPVLNLISIGGQHQGIYGLPRCFGDSNPICNYIRRLINIDVYNKLVQDNIVQAEFWHDPLNEDLYRERSVFLADINNDKSNKNETYKSNLLKLKNLVLVKFLNDSIVQPRESSWFEFYTAGQAKTITKLQDAPIYKEDWLGLKQLDQSGRLKLLAVEGDHLQFSIDWFEKAIVQPFIK